MFRSTLCRENFSYQAFLAWGCNSWTICDEASPFFFPDAKIDWVIKEELSEILKASGFIHQIFDYQRQGGIYSYLGLILKIRRNKYDYIFDLQGLLRSGIITFFAKGRTKLGVADGREFSTIFYSSIGEKKTEKKRSMQSTSSPLS